VISSFGEKPCFLRSLRISRSANSPGKVPRQTDTAGTMNSFNEAPAGFTGESSRGRRARPLVVLVGQKRAVAIAVRNVSGRRRWSKLNEWLAAPTGRHNNAR